MQIHPAQTALFYVLKKTLYIANIIILYHLSIIPPYPRLLVFPRAGNDNAEGLEARLAFD